MDASTAVVGNYGRRRRGWSISRATVSVVVIAGIALQVTYGTGHGFASAKAWSQDQMQVADITVNYQKASSLLLGHNLVLGYPDKSRTLSEFMAVHGLSIFGTADKSYYASVGLFPVLTSVQTDVIVPTHGATLGGEQPLDAGASDASGVRSVLFFTTDSSGHRSLVGTGRLTKVGWLALWNTRTVPNGRYSLVSVAAGYGVRARIAQSAPVRVTIDN
jgi:hypothetical protein